MDIERLKRRKRELHLTNEEVSRLTGVPLGTVQKVLGRTTKNPRKETLIALAKLLDPQLARELETGSSMVQEHPLPYDPVPTKNPGEYTLEDYYALPEDQRAELIDGTIYDMTAPSFEHQIIAGEIHAQLLRCTEEHRMPCMPGIAPIDVQLDRDDRTMVQPDVIIAFDPELNIGRCLYGAPEFVLEVLSPSTRAKDQVLKLSKYKNAGCLEYWIVDPENKRVLVYCFLDDNWPQVYSFADRLPVRVSNSLCSIDFTVISEKLQKLSLPADQEELAHRREVYEKWMEMLGAIPH